MKKVMIRKQDVDAMIAYAREKLPHEACGLSAGTEDSDERIADIGIWIQTAGTWKCMM